MLASVRTSLILLMASVFALIGPLAAAAETSAKPAVAGHVSAHGVEAGGHHAHHAGAEAHAVDHASCNGGPCSTGDHSDGYCCHVGTSCCSSAGYLPSQAAFLDRTASAVDLKPGRSVLPLGSLLYPPHRPPRAAV